MSDELFDAVYDVVTDDKSVFEFTDDLALYKYISPLVCQLTDDYYAEQIQYNYMTREQAADDQEDLILHIINAIMK